MKRTIMLFLCLLMLAAAGCGGGGGGSDTPATPGTTEDIMTIPKGVAI